MNLQQLSQDDAYLLAKIEAVFRCADTDGFASFTAFLDERQQEMARQLAIKQGVDNFLLYGGYIAATRCICGAFPNYIDIDDDPSALFEVIAAVTLRFRVEDTLTHRDFLGALMNLGIKRETLGDILVGDGISVIFCTHPIATLMLTELTKVGRVGVKTEQGAPENLPITQRFDELHDTISSMRLDCIVASLANCSRGQAAQLIRQGHVTQSYEVAKQGSQLVSVGNKIAIRGYGKFLIAEEGGLTKKGRIHILYKKYI